MTYAEYRKRKPLCPHCGSNAIQVPVDVGSWGCPDCFEWTPTWSDI